MKISETLIVSLLKLGVCGETKNFKTSISIPGKTKNDEPTTIVITAETLKVHILKEDK